MRDYSIRLDKAEVLIDLSPGSNRSEDIKVIIANDRAGVFNVSINCGNLQVTPAYTTIILTDHVSGPIRFTVSVPSDYPIQPPWEKVTCSVVQREGGGNGSTSRSSGFVVSLWAEPSLDLDCNGHAKLPPGKYITIICKVRNTGVLPDSFVVEITNARELEAQGWHIEYQTPLLTNVSADNYKIFRATLTTPDEKLCCFINEYHVIEMRAESVEWGIYRVTDESSYLIWVRGASYSPWAVVMFIEALILVLATTRNLALRATLRRLKNKVSD